MNPLRCTKGIAAERAPPRPASRPAPVSSYLFFALMALHVLPLWTVGRFPSQDGPAHLENAVALLHHGASAVFRRYYVVNAGFQPNWFSQVVLAALVRVLSPAMAEKALLTGYAVALPLAFRYALPRTERGRWIALAIFPFAYAYPFHMGFWNFSFSLVFFFVVIGFWSRTRGRLSARRGLGLTLLTLLLFFCHSVSTAAALGGVLGILASRALLAALHARGVRRRFALRAYARRAAAVVAFASPAVLLLGLYLLRHRDHATARAPVAALAAKLVGLHALVSFDRREVLFSAPIGVAILVSVLYLVATRGGRRWRPADAWLGAAAVFVVLYFSTPDVVAGGAFVSDRLALYPFLAALLWMGSAAVPVRHVRRLSIGIAALSLCALGLHAAKLRQLDRYLAEYASAAEEVPRGSVFLPLDFAPHGLDPGGRELSYRVKPFAHAAGWIAAEREAVDLDNSQANTDYGSLEFAAELNPFRVMPGPRDGLEREPPCVDFSGYARAGGRIDRIIVFGATPAAFQDPCGAAIARQLAARYEPVFVSRAHALVQVYRPRRVEDAPRSGRRRIAVSAGHR